MNPAKFKLTPRFTRKKKVLSFLRRYEDNNPIHQFPIEIIPGMYYLHLASRNLESSRCISQVNLSFKGIRRYPIPDLELLVEKSDGIQKLKFRDDEDLAEVHIQYSENGGTFSGNIDRMDLLRQVPGDLLRFANKFGAYLGQTFEFLEQPDEKIVPQFKIIKEGTKSSIIATEYYSGDRLVARGKAYTLNFTPEILQAISKASRVPVHLISETLEGYIGKK